MPLTFDVSRTDVRDRFLRVVVREAVTTLEADIRPAWGRMTPQQMVEHLTWMFDVSVGAAQVPCFVGEEQQKQIRIFLYDEHPSPRNLRNPALAAGLPPLRSPDFAAAIAAMDLARRRYVDLDESSRRVAFAHPVFGPLVHEEWSRFHYKHVFHHLLQFGLIDV